MLVPAVPTLTESSNSHAAVQLRASTKNVTPTRQRKSNLLLESPTLVELFFLLLEIVFLTCRCINGWSSGVTASGARRPDPVATCDTSTSYVWVITNPCLPRELTVWCACCQCYFCISCSSSQPLKLLMNAALQHSLGNSRPCCALCGCVSALAGGLPLCGPLHLVLHLLVMESWKHINTTPSTHAH